MYIKKIVKYCALLIFFTLFIQIMNLILISIGRYLSNQVFNNMIIKNQLIGIIQETFQATMGIVLFFIIIKGKISDLGINALNFKKSIRIFLYFSLISSTIVILFLIIIFYYQHELWNTFKQPIPKSPVKTISLIIFQLIFPGLGEEILFRGFFITLSKKLLKEINLLIISLISGIIFSTAHIYYNIIPLQVFHIDYIQLSVAFACGVYYSIVFLKTNSLVAPILSHNYFNVFMTICSFVIINT